MGSCGCTSSDLKINENFTANGKSFSLMEREGKDEISMYVTDESSKTVSPIYSVNFKGICSCSEPKDSAILKDLKSALKEATLSSTKKWLSNMK